VSGLVARVSGKVDVPGRTEAAPMGRTIAYCRVSSRDQNPQLQLDALHAHGYDHLFAEKESGKHGVQRPEFSRALATLQAADTLVFWKSDRWGRSAAANSRPAARWPGAERLKWREQITDNKMSAPTDSSMSSTACSLTSAGAETAVHRH
jgi:hypothetical protein